MQNSFLRLGNKLINLDHVAYINREKGENGNYYEVYTSGNYKPHWTFVESSVEGKALMTWFERQNPTYGYEQETKE